MKKLLLTISSILLILVLTACDTKGKNADSDKNDESEGPNPHAIVVEDDKFYDTDEDSPSKTTKPDNTEDFADQSKEDNQPQSDTETVSDDKGTNNNNTQSTQTDSSKSNTKKPSGNDVTNNNNTSQSNTTKPSNNKVTNNHNQSAQNNVSQSNNSTPSKNNITNNHNQSTQNNVSQSNNNTSSNNNVTNHNQSTQNNPSQSNNSTPSNGTTANAYENIDNGVLEKVTSEKMNVPQNMELLGTNDAKEENNSKNMKATVALYQLDGNVVNWVEEKGLLYVITAGNNRLVVINEKTMMAVANVPLAGSPAEMNLVGDEIYISLPDLCRIDIFSKSDFEKTSSLYFDHEVSSFCVNGDYIYYSEHSQHCEVYKKNITTEELTKILPNSGWTFYQPKLYLNKQDNILYIGESGSSGSTLYYYDATTLQLKSVFKKDNYGIMNHTRDIFHIGDDIIWGNYRLSDTNGKHIVGKYGNVPYGSVNFASKELVSTFEGIFLADTYECIINYFDAGFKFEYVLVTDSYNLFFRARTVDNNIIIGINFSMQ